MVNGTLASFQRVWDLVGTVSNHFETTKNTFSHKIDEKLRKELYKMRNTQLCMVFLHQF